MTPKALDSKLTQLEAFRYKFGGNTAARLVKLLKALNAAHFTDSASLIRFHETLLFLRAFPQSAAVLHATERMLRAFHRKVEALQEAGADMDDFDTFAVSGIAGTQMEDTLSFDVAKWLVNIRHLQGKVEVAWENYEPGRELGNTGPRVMPLLEDDAFVEADTPWRRWLETASGKKSSVPAWLIQRCDDLPLPPPQKTELYDSLRVPLRWSLGNSLITRTRNWKPVSRIFFHSEPLISRREVSLANELARAPLKLTRLSRKQGDEIMELIRQVMLVRYRELYGTTLGDARSVVKADLGTHDVARGVSIYLWNLPPDCRLPLRAYVAGLTLKNGVPINYIEAIALCEWVEVGFNTFYTFRGGEAGWIYSQVLRSLYHLMGTTCVSVYPYQLGHDNEEAIESGAFWFYRKLGFRPGRADLQRLVEREEGRIAADPKYRTPAATLRRLAAGHVFYELPGSKVGAWDSFSTRNIGLRVNRQMAQDFQGSSASIRKQSARSIERILQVDTSLWTASERANFSNFALLLALIPDLRSWNHEEKESLLQIIRSKSKADEMVYLHLTQQHERFRQALLQLGSSSRIESK